MVVWHLLDRISTLVLFNPLNTVPQVSAWLTQRLTPITALIIILW